MKLLFNLDLSAGLTDDLLSHKMGVVDEEYVLKSCDSHAAIGRKVNIAIDEVRALGQIIGKLGRWLSDAMERIRPWLHRS